MSAIAVALCSGRHSPAFRQGAVAAVEALQPPPADAAGTPPWVRTSAEEGYTFRLGRRGFQLPATNEQRPRPQSAGPFPGHAPGELKTEASARLRSRSCSPSLARPGLGRRPSPRCVLPLLCVRPALNGGELANAPASTCDVALASGTLLAALLPPGAAAEKQRQDAKEYATFARRLPLFALWREHMVTAQTLRWARLLLVCD
jgi:hypothetical protein